MLTQYPEMSAGIEAAQITINIARQGWTEIVAQKEAFGQAVWNLQGFAQSKLIGELPQGEEIPQEFANAKAALFDLVVSPQAEDPEAFPVVLGILIKLALQVLSIWLGS